jgi:hypothetical protein
MMTFIYWSIVVYLLILTVWSLFREPKGLLQLNSAMVAIVLLLRAAGIK